MEEYSVSPINLIDYEDTTRISWFDNGYILIIVLAFLILNLIFAKKNIKIIKQSIVCFVVGITLYFLGYLIIMNEVPNGIEYHSWKYVISNICNIISIIIQLIPFIICLKNNKKVKKDEVKQ